MWRIHILLRVSAFLVWEDSICVFGNGTFILAESWHPCHLICTVTLFPFVFVCRLLTLLLTSLSYGWVLLLAKELYAHLREITKPGGEFVVRNFVGVVEDISVEASLV